MIPVDISSDIAYIRAPQHIPYEHRASGAATRYLWLWSTTPIPTMRSIWSTTPIPTMPETQLRLKYQIQKPQCHLFPQSFMTCMLRMPESVYAMILAYTRAARDQALMSRAIGHLICTWSVIPTRQCKLCSYILLIFSRVSYSCRIGQTIFLDIMSSSPNPKHQQLCEERVRSISTPTYQSLTHSRPPHCSKRCIPANINKLHSQRWYSSLSTQIQAWP